MLCYIGKLLIYLKEIKGKNTEIKQHSKNNTYLYLYCCETIVGGYRSVGPEQISYLFNNLVEYDLN